MTLRYGPPVAVHLHHDQDACSHGPGTGARGAYGVGVALGVSVGVAVLDVGVVVAWMSAWQSLSTWA